MERLDFFSPEDLERVSAAVLSFREAGAVILLPTETFYGLAVDPFSDAGVRKLCCIKGRPQGMPLPVLVSGWPQLEKLCLVPNQHRSWLEEQWPGPLTAILPSRIRMAASKLDTVALRIPDHDLLRSLLERVGPLTGTSANAHQKAPSTTVEAALQSLVMPPDLVLDGGQTPGRRATRIVRFSGSHRFYER